MDEQERGHLLIEQEETGESIERLRSELRKMGQVLARLGGTLSDNPERVIFSNAPPPLGNFQSDLQYEPAIPWSSIDRTTIGQKIQELRELRRKLDTIKFKLRGDER